MAMRCDQIGARSGSTPLMSTKLNNMYIVRQISGLWIVQRKHSQQIVFSHKELMKAYEWQFKQVNHA